MLSSYRTHLPNALVRTLYLTNCFSVTSLSLSSRPVADFRGGLSGAPGGPWGGDGSAGGQAQPLQGQRHDGHLLRCDCQEKAQEATPKSVRAESLEGNLSWVIGRKKMWHFGELLFIFSLILKLSNIVTSSLIPNLSVSKTQQLHFFLQHHFFHLKCG